MAQVRLDKDVATYVVDEMDRIRTQEATDLSAAQAVNRMLREWRKTRDAEMPQRKAAKR